MFCPLYTNKNVELPFNLVIQTFGGRPLSEEEFKSADLRNLRSGFDYSAMEFAYDLYDQNNGFTIDMAPNGELSGLFLELLNATGSLDKAIRIKSRMFLDLKYKTNLDINGEPLTSNFLKENDVHFTDAKLEAINLLYGIYDQQRPVFVEKFFGKNLSTLNKGLQVSSKDILQHLLNVKYIPNINTILANVLVKHDVPVLFGELPIGKPMSTVTKNGGSVIIIDYNQIRNLNVCDASNLFLHEIIHALTVKAIDRPETTEEIKFKLALLETYDFFNNLIKESEYSRFNGITGALILKDTYEFAAEFATNRDSKFLLYEKAVALDKEKNGKARYFLKKFINRFSNFLFKRSLFNLKSDEFNKFKNQFDNFILHRAVIDKGNIKDSDMYNAVYNTADITSLENSTMFLNRINMMRFLDDADSHYASLTEEQKKEADEAGMLLRSSIATMLNSRLIAIKGTRALSQDEKIKYTQITNIQVSNLLNSELGIAQSLSSLYSLTIPQLLEDITALRQKDDITDTEYMYNMHNNFATYHNIFNMIVVALSDPQFNLYISEQIESLPDIQKSSALSSLQALKSQAGDAMYVSEQGVGYMRHALVKIVRLIAKEVCDYTGSDELATWLSELNETTHDTYKLIRQLGAKQNSRDITVRAIIELINRANRNKVKDTNKKVNQLLRLKDNLSSGESMLDLYERDSNGKFTSYLVRYLNYGEAYFRYKDFIKKVNKLYGLPENNNIAPDSEEEVEFKSFFDESRDAVKMGLRQAWNKHKNEFLSRNYERKYLPEYYEAYDNLSQDTIEALSKIRDRINEIKAKAKKDSKGNILFDTLTDEDWKSLQGLYIERRQLLSFENYDGTLKDKNSREYKIAEQLQKLNQTLYNSDLDYHDREAWLEARLKKLDELSELYKDDENSLIKILLDIHKWDERNSRVTLKKDENGNALIWEKINEEVEIVSDVSASELVFDIGDNGEEYESNKKRINNILNMYKDKNTGEVNLDYFPASAKSIITKLQDRNKQIRIAACSVNKDLKIKYKKYKAAQKLVFLKYIKFVKSELYRRKYGNLLDDVKIPRWGTKMIVIYKPEEFVDLAPGDGWISKDDRNDLANPEFERLSKIEGNEDMYMIPKENLYKNKDYEKVQNSPTLKALHSEILKTMKESNDNYFDENKIDAYKLPQISGSMFRYINSSGTHGAVKYMRELLGFIDEGQGIRQDESYASSIFSVLDSPDEFLAMVSKESDLRVKHIRGTSADGRAFSVVPVRFVSPLSDPSMISQDLIGIVGQYYESSANSKYKNQIKDKIESLIDMLEYRHYLKTDENGNERQIAGNQTDTYKSARKAADMFLYGIVTDQMRAGNVEYSKITKLAQHATTAINLGVNPAVAITGFFSSAFAHLVNAIVGDLNYSLSDMINAVGISAVNGIKTGFGLTEMSNQRSDNKVTVFMEYFNLVNQLDKKYKKTHLNRFARFVSDNYTFGLLSGTDFIIKSNIMVTMLLSHHFFNGEFVSKEDIFGKQKLASEEEGKNMLDEWKNGVSVWDAVEVVDGEIKPKEEYKDAFEKSIDLIYERIIYVAEKADGVATETQKAEITTTFIGAAAMIHRQYLPLLWQDRMSSTVYNLDTRSYQQGSFNTILYQMCFNFIANARKEALAIKRLNEDESFFKNFGKSYKKLWKNYFSYINEDGTLKTENELKLIHFRRRHVKRVATELAVGYMLFHMLVPLIFAGANDPENKDDLIYQFNAYVARRVQWESMNVYNPSDALSNIRTLTAETSLIDKVWNVGEYGYKSLLDVLSTDDSLKDELIYQSGIYKGKHKFPVSLFKLFLPAHNVYEQYLGSRAKRRYYENNVMRIDKSEQWVGPEISRKLRIMQSNADI